MKKSSLLLVSAASACLGLAACGGDDAPGSVADTRDAAAGAHADAGLDAAASVTQDAGDVTRDAGDKVADTGIAADAGSQSITLRFKAKVGTEDLVCGHTYANQGSSKVSITPQDFRFYVQEVRLVTSSGAEVPLTFDERLPFQSQGVALIDFTNDDGACSNSNAPTTNTTITGTAPAGDYTGIVLVNGVSEALNHADPTSPTTPAPLQAPGASWGWTLGYRFLMAEVLGVSGAGADAGVVADAGAAHAADGGVAAPAASEMHLGSTGCMGTPADGISCSNPNRTLVRLMGFRPATSTIIADLGAVFAKPDLSSSVQCHGSGPACGPMFEALGVNVTTGAPLSTQSVYRLE
jgi:uncharacterized repeat protein (TIGR04052 family)